MKTVVTQTTCSQLIKRWHVDGSAKSARGSKTDIVKQNDDNIGRFAGAFTSKRGGAFASLASSTVDSG